MKWIDKIHVKFFINSAYGEYYFSDTPTSSDENFPGLAKAEMAKKKRDVGSIVWWLYNFINFNLKNKK